MTVQYRPAESDREVRAGYDLAARVFGPNYVESKAHKDRLLALEPPIDVRDVVVGCDGGEVVAIVRIVNRAIRLGASTLKAGGITAVAVDPGRRGQGIGRAVMEAAIARSRQRGDTLSIAFARRAVDGFYWRLGYVGVGCHPRITVRVGAVPQSGSVSIEDGLSAAAVQMCRGFYAASYGELPLSFVRDDTAWALIAQRLSWPPAARLVMVKDSGNPAGYYIVSEGIVIEAAGDPAPLKAALLQYEATPGGELVLNLLPEHPVARLFRGQNHTTSVRYAWDGGHVVRVLDAQAFAQGLHEHARQWSPPEWRRLDLEDHADARRMLCDAAGITVGTPGSLSPLPAWTRVDEF